MNNINLFIGYIPHFFVVAIYIYCLIIVYKLGNNSFKRNSFLAYFLLGTVTSIVAIFAIRSIGIMSVLFFYIFDFYFFLRYGNLYKKTPFLLILSLCSLAFILSYLFKIDEMINILSLIVNVLIISIFIFYFNKQSFNIESIFWFNSSYLIHSISILFCDVTLILGKFNDRSWTYLFIYFIIYFVYSIKNILLLKSYKCEFKKIS